MSQLTKWNPFEAREALEPWSGLSRWEPFRDMERSFSRLERMLGLLPGNGGHETMTITQWSPTVDITEDEKEFVVKAELPEVKKEDVKLTVEDGVLTIRGERKSEKEEKGKKYHRIERSYGSFERSFSLPETTEAGKISSEFKEGVLTVHLPKNPNVKPKALEIKVQ